APPYIATLSLHDALPISPGRADPAAVASRRAVHRWVRFAGVRNLGRRMRPALDGEVQALTDGTDIQQDREQRRIRLLAVFQLARSEEHTSELQSLAYLVC